MRFPNTPFMKRTFDLMENRNLNIKLIDYIFTAPHTFHYYPYSPEGYVDDKYLAEGADTIVKDMLAPLKAPFKELPIDQAIEVLMQVDQHSTRSYMALALKPPYPSSAIHWCETMDKSTGWYDRALTETVLESLAFQWTSDSPKDIEWKCIE